MPSDRPQGKVDSRKKLLRLSYKEQPSDTHTISEVTTSDLNWLPADHHSAEIEDEAAVDPWNTNIEEKETSNKTTEDFSNTADDDVGIQIYLFPDLAAKTPKNDMDAIAARIRLKLFNALEAWPSRHDFDSSSARVRLKLFNALDEWLQESDVQAISNNVNHLHPSSNNDLIDEQLDILDPDRLNDERAAQAVDDGFEEFALDNQTNEEPEGDFDIPEFNAAARQPPWEIEPETEDQSLRLARMKAATITNLLDFRSISERNETISYLTKLFIQMTHPATFRAIQRVVEGIDLDTLKAIVELRRIWMRRTDWWLGRYDKMFAIAPLKSGASAFTWNTARLVCLARKDYPPESMIDDEWLDEWLQLSSLEPGYLSFPSYIEEKVCYRDIELLDRGLRHLENSNDHSKVDDSFDWYQPVSDHNKTIQDNFHIITLYRD